MTHTLRQCITTNCRRLATEPESGGLLVWCRPCWGAFLKGRAAEKRQSAAPDLLKAMEEIAKGEGAFSTDPLEHAGNTIDSMKSLAKAAIARITP